MDFPDHLRLPYVYPTPEGGIQAEWTFNSTEISLEIDLDQKTGDWHEYDPDSEYEVAESLDLKKPRE